MYLFFSYRFSFCGHFFRMNIKILSFKDNEKRGAWISGDLIISGEIHDSDSQLISQVWGNNPCRPLRGYRTIIELTNLNEKLFTKVIKINNLKIRQVASHLIVYSKIKTNQKIKLSS